MLGRLYLIVYNFVLAAGWGMVFHEMVNMLGPCSGSAKPLLPGPLEDAICVTGAPDKVVHWLKYFQTAAVLEVFHALFGLVRSSAFTVFKQVTSRIVVLWLVVWVVPPSAAIPEFVLMVIAWSVTEIIRYSWYGFKELLGSAPYPLTWLRYTTFIVLYPLGVYGEQCCNYQTLKMLAGLGPQAAKCGAGAKEYLTKLDLLYTGFMTFFMLLYIPLFPGMYLHMFGQRKKHLGAPRRAKPTEGIQFPIDSKGGRSTSATGQLAFAASIFHVDPQAAAAVLKERNWRFGYEKHVIKNVELACRSAETCVSIADAGLKFLHNNFQFNRGEKSMTLAEAMSTITDSFVGTYTVTGNMPKPDNLELVVPYRRKSYPAVSPLEYMTDDVLIEQLEKWAAAGTIEPSARDAIAAASKSKPWLDLSDRYFVLLGAGSAMGPYEILLKHGANIVALDLDRPHIWKRLVNMARDSWGSIIFPLKVHESTIKDDDERLFENAGCNLFTQTPEICNWICNLFPDKEFVIGGYAYLDGEAHVRVSLAMDAIMSGAIERRKTKTTLAYLCSPTDVFVRDLEAHKAAEANLAKSSLVKTVCNAVRCVAKSVCKRNIIPLVKAGDQTYSIVNGIVVPQGPNYALAKRLQHWRAMLSWSNGSPVSTNIAPSTATVSVVHNKQFAAAYGGFGNFYPLEVAFQETSNAVMGALLIHDVCNPKSKAQPDSGLVNPIQLFAPGAFHGGIWRCAYTIGSIGEMSAGFFYLGSNKFTITFFLAGLSAAAAASAGLLDVDQVVDMAQQTMKQYL